MNKQLVKESTAFPALDIKSGKEIWLGCTDDLVIDVIHHTDEPHENGYNVMVTVNQPCKDIVDAEMLLVSMDVDDWEQVMTPKQIKAALVDIEVSALELSTGNFEDETFESDCEHIATLARQLRDHLINEAEEETQRWQNGRRYRWEK